MPPHSFYGSWFTCRPHGSDRGGARGLNRRRRHFGGKLTAEAGGRFLLSYSFPLAASSPLVPVWRFIIRVNDLPIDVLRVPAITGAVSLEVSSCPSCSRSMFGPQVALTHHYRQRSSPARQSYYGPFHVHFDMHTTATASPYVSTVTDSLFCMLRRRI